MNSASNPKAQTLFKLCSLASWTAVICSLHACRVCEVVKFIGTTMHSMTYFILLLLESRINEDARVLLVGSRS